MAANLAGYGTEVHCFDIDEERRKFAEEHGLIAASSSKNAVEGAGVVFTCLPRPEHLISAVLGPIGILDYLANNFILVDLSTVDPKTVYRVGMEVRNRSGDMIDAPITRSVEMAWQGKAALLVGGKTETIERVTPFLNALSENITLCGPLGSGTAMKLVNNFMAASILASVTESLSVGLKAGLRLETIMETCARSGTSNKMLLEILPAAALRGHFEPGFRAELALKDILLFLSLADELGSSLEVGPVVGKMLEDLATKTPDSDISALLQRKEAIDGFSARLSNANR